MTDLLWTFSYFIANSCDQCSRPLDLYDSFSFFYFSSQYKYMYSYSLKSIIFLDENWRRFKCSLAEYLIACTVVQSKYICSNNNLKSRIQKSKHIYLDLRTCLPWKNLSLAFPIKTRYKKNCQQSSTNEAEQLSSKFINSFFPILWWWVD